MFNSLVGIGLRQPHYSNFITSKPFVGWVEVHSENYLCCGGASFDYLMKIRKDYPVSLHGIAMSLGSADGLDYEHLKQLKELINIIEPCFISDHLSWSSKDNHFLPELLPIPYNDESLEIFSSNISVAQDFLNKEILFENPSTYFEYNNSCYKEEDFLNLLADKTGAGILLDVNNIYVSSFNNEWSAEQYLNSVKPKHIKEIHLAGHSENIIGEDKKLLLDSHDNIVCTEVWDLYKKALSIFGSVPTLIEWDSKIPELQILLLEAQKAHFCLQEIRGYANV
ncbi:MAG: DUF692 domain-containing protein [Rickettsiaceae bacterium]